MKTFVIIPRAGLGNRLLVWAKGVVFSHLNDTDLYLIGLNKLHIGPFLRNEKSKRFYFNSFKFRLPITDYINYFFIKRKRVLIEPSIEKLNNTLDTDGVIFNKIPHWTDYFNGIKNYRLLIKSELLKLINKRVYHNFIKASSPYIGVHIRMGDFKEVRNINEMKNIGLARTPISYFIDCIKKIRDLKKYDLPVSVFSDGHKEELSDILQLKNVELFNSGDDLLDLLVLSKSKIIITSLGSTFSYWASFLSDADVINNPLDIQPRLRIDNNLFEGPLELYNHSKSGYQL